MAGASIVVDIKAQITGYQQEIEKIKAELKKIDPGSLIGKGLNRTLVQAELKLALLSRNAEKRITSQGLLDHLFDLLHMVNDLMRNLGLGMSNVGIEDVLETASAKARELGLELLQVKTEMSSKGANFFDELKKTNPKELSAVLDLLKFDPKTMGIDAFVEKFREATQLAKDEVRDLTKLQQEASAELDKAKTMKAARDQLPIALQGTNVTLAAIRNAFGTGRNGMDAAKLVSDRDAAAQAFIDKIRSELEKDTNRSAENKANLTASLETTLTLLQEAKTKEQILNILLDLDKALKSTKGEGHGGSYKGIAGLTGDSINNGLIEKLSQTTYLADENFVNLIRELSDLLSKSSNADALGAGLQIQNILNSLLLPTDISTFRDNMDALIREILNGLKKMNSSASDFDVKTKDSIVKLTETALEAAKGLAVNLEKISSTSAYDKLMAEYTGLAERMQRIEEMLGLEKTNNRAGTAAGINAAGLRALSAVPQMNDAATNSLRLYSSVLEDVLARLLMVGKVEGIAQRWFSVYAVVRMVTKAFRNMTENVKALDKTMTEIAIVTDMNLGDLWKLMPTYTAMARKYGATLQGVYEVSLLYYQQGLEQDDVMALTELTLKMARISGLDYSDATNYMTNAIRSFKIEMLDALRVVDVYSALAASSASSTTELATAMSKTASSAAAVGSSFEATSAMMAVMIETTRESPENIGSALKSIISRYGELKENKTGIDEEGEEYSLNKVDTALLSVGISIHDAQGLFRDFDDVIMELAEHWNTIDTNTLRYIATVMAGNRQLSRFLALVSNGERLAELNETAANSEDASTLQVLKTMDSIDYKSQLLLTTLLSLYTSTGVENLFKGILDGANLIVETFTLMPTLFLLPIPALMSLATNFISVANIVMTTLRALKLKFTALWELSEAEMTAKAKLYGTKRVQDVKKEEAEKVAATLKGVSERATAEQGQVRMKTSSKLALGALLAGVGMNLAAGLISDKGVGNRAAKAGLGIGGSMLLYGALGAMFAPGNPLIGAGVGALIGGLMGVWLNISYIWESTADLAKRLKEEAEASEIEYKLKKAVTTNTEKEIANVKKLADALFDSVEAREKYTEAANKLATDIPELVNYYDAEGNAILDLSNAYSVLAEKRKEANDASRESAQNSLEAANKAIEEKQEIIDKVVTEGISSSIDFKNLKGTAKEKWENVKKTDNIMGWAAAAEFGGGKGNDLGGIMLIANLQLLANTPGLNELYNLMVLDDGTLLRKLIETPEKRDAMFKQWQEELTSITDPATNAVIDFVLYLLLGVSTEFTSAFGELNLASALRTATIHSNAAEYVNNFIADTRVMADYGPAGEEKDAAKATLEMFKGIENSSEILTNFLTQEFLSGKYGNSWDDFIKVLEDPEQSPILNMINLLNQIPKTLLTELNNLLLDKGRYAKDVMLLKITTLLGNSDLALAIIDTYSNYYDNLIDTDTFKEKINKTDTTFFSYNKLLNDDLSINLSGEEMSTILDMQNKINSMYDTGRITRADARYFMNAYSDLWGTGDEAILLIVSHITDFSSEGLQDLYDMIDSSDEFASDEAKEALKLSLLTLYGFIPQNLNTGLKSYEEEMVNATKEYSKDITSATKGMDYETASELSKKLDIDTSTEYFDVKDGELFLKNTQLIYDHYFGEKGISTLLTSKMLKYSNNLKLHIEGLNQLNLKDLDEETLTQALAEEFGIDLVTLKQVVKDFKDSDLDAITGEWVTSYFLGEITNAEELVNKLIGSGNLTRAIDSGKLEDIAKAALPKEANESTIKSITALLRNALDSGNFDEIIDNKYISKELKAQLPQLTKDYKETLSSVIDDLIGGLNTGFSYIEGNDYNQDLFKVLLAEDLVDLTEPVNGISNAIIKSGADQAIKVLNLLQQYQGKANQLGLSESELREKIASLRQDIYEKSLQGTLLAILDNYENINEVAYKNFVDLWSNISLEGIFIQRADGTYKANLTKLAEAYHKGSIAVNDVVSEKLEELINEAIDESLNSITDATNYINKGTTRFTDMAKFVKRFNDAIPEANYGISDLFEYDTNLNQFTLDSNMLRRYIISETEVLKELGFSAETATEYINDLTTTLLRQNMDITGILSDADTKAQKNAATTLSTAVLNYLDLGNVIYGHIIDDASYLNRLEKIQSEATSTEDANKATVELVLEFLYGTKLTADLIMQSLYRGGEEGVNVLKLLRGEELTSDEVVAVYNAGINRIRDAEEALSSGVGTILLGMAAEIATTSSGIETSTLPDGSVVITAVSSMVDVYANLYLRMKGTAEATTADLNTAFAKVLTAKDQGNIDAIQALGNAMGMTYESLGNLLAQYGEGLWANLEFVMQHLLTAGIESLGNGQIRITDFEKFSRRMNWEIGGEAYMEAYKAYNDSLIELDRKTSKTIVEEIKSVSEAKTGDKVNVTYLTNAIEGGEAAVNEALSGLGAEVNKGILEIKSGARIGDIVTALGNLAQANGQAITSELAELADAVESFLDNIVSLLQSGISGNLDNAGANNLREWAKEYANLDLDFTRTADGLRLSELAAIQLYNTLKGIDSIKASLVFDSLSESLQKNNDNFRSTTALMGHIKDISDGIYQSRQADGKISSTRLKQYEAELEIAKEILAARSTQEDDSWNFMSNKIPAAQNNPLNFASNWTLALGKIRDAWNLSHVKKKGKTGFMDYTDFYNIVTQMNDMARIGGEIEVGAYKLDGSLESAAKLIEAGASSLTAVDTGEVMVNLGQIGLLLSQGGSELESGITEGVLSIAHAQVEALDGIIAMLELIVSMEQLGDIDVDENGIDLSDLFKVTYDSEGNRTYTEFSEDYKKWVADIKDKINKDSKNYNEDLANAVNGITIEGISLAQILDWKPEDFTNEANASIAKAYTAILDAFTKAALSGNYNLENIQQSVLSVLSESGLDGLVTLDIGDITYVVSAHSITTIDWKDSDTDAILTNIARLEGREKLDIQKDLTTWILKRGTDKLEPQQLIYSLAILKKIVIDDKGNVTSVTVDGKDYNTTNSSEAQLNAAVNAAVLEQAGYDVTNWKIKEGTESTVEVETKIGNKIIKVESENGQVRLVSADGKREYKDQAEFLKGEYHQWLEDTTGKSREGLYKSKEEWQWGEYKIATEIAPLFTFGDTDEVISPQNNPELRQKLEEIVRGGHDSIEAYFNKNMTDNRDGTYTVNIGSSKFTFTGGDQAAANFEKLITESLGIDLGLKDTIVQGISEAIPSIIESLNSIEASGPAEAASALNNMLTALKGLEGINYDTIATNLAKLQFAGFDGSYKNKSSNNTSTLQVGMDASGLLAIIQSLTNINPSNAENAKKHINDIDPSGAKDAADAINNISIKGLHVTATANITVLIGHGSVGYKSGGGSTGGGTAAGATGNIALASGTLTLMGELGPELVVSNGHYFLAGLTGAEFVNLDKDAIVFNHKQTERLFSLGAIGSRGKPFTNELNAISFAKGTGPAYPAGNKPVEDPPAGTNPLLPRDPVWGEDWGYTYTIRAESGGVSGHLWGAPIASIDLGSASAKGNVKTTGPAKASASAALAALRQLRAQWLALEKLTAKDLAGKGGGGGGGGGKDAAFIKDLERWFDLLQEIAKLEQEITYQETLRSKLASDLTPNGSAYAKSQAETLSYLQREVAAAELLSLEQEDYFKKRQDALNKQSAFSELYTFDDEGQIKYEPGKFTELSEVFGGNDVTGKPNHSILALYEWLRGQGYGYAMLYDESGQKIKVKNKGDTEGMKAAIEAFWAKIESDKQEMQELHDSVEDQKKAVLEKMQEENELLKEIEDNQISVENKVLKAVEDVALREIDKLDDLKNAIEKSNLALIDGLSNALDKERQLYENSESERELDRKRRLLDILRRSGGSAAEIANLQADIDLASRDLYFDKQQEQIDAIQAASDEQLQKLNNQIDLMKESLEYQKEHGLLWNKVAEIMSTAPEDIANYIKENTKDYWGKSPTDLMLTVREDLFEAQQYVAYRDTVTDKLEVVANLLARQGLDSEWDSFDKMMKEDAGYKQSWSKLTSDLKNSLKAIYGSVLADTGDPNAAARAIWESDLAKELGLIKLLQLTTVTPAKTTTTSTSKTTSSTSSATRYGLKMVNGRYQVIALKAGKYKTKAEALAQANSLNSIILGSEEALKGINNPVKSASGGYVNHGIYELGELGTETVFTASQTKILRDNILSNRPNSLISLLKSYNEGYKGLSQSTYDSISNKSITTTTIERAEVNLLIEKLANDYDSKRAANTIMDEMLRIASKTSANNSVRR